MSKLMTEQDYYKLIEENKDIAISKSVQVAVDWWADRMDGTVDPNESFIQKAKNFFPDNYKDWLALQILIQKFEQLNKGSKISQAQSQKFRKNMRILLQTRVNERKYEFLTSDKNRATFILAVGCHLCGIDNDRCMLPENVLMSVSNEKVEIDYTDNKQNRNEVLYDAKHIALENKLVK